MGSHSRASLFILVLGLFALVSPALTAASAETSRAAAARAAEPPRSAPANAIARADAKSASTVASPPPSPASDAPPPPDAERTRSDDDEQAAWCAERLARLADVAPADPARAPRRDGALRDRLGARGGVSFIVATLPDPIDSGFAFELDADLAAIDASLDPLYVRERFWLAWSDADADGKDDADRAARCRKIVPSALLYRARDASTTPRHLVVFVVGESPTAGVHRRALRAALDMADEPTARVLGPTYSGSAESMREVLDAWTRAAPGRRVEVRSGSATSPENVRLRGPDVSFRATTVPDDALKAAFYAYLLDGKQVTARGRVLDRVAILAESGTDYGGTYAQREGAPAADATRATDASPTPSPAGCACGGASNEYVPSFTLHFPMHVSSVRSAYGAQPGDDPAPASVPRTALTPALGDGSGARDRIPDLSPRTKYAEDLAIANLLDEIVHNDIRFVGIVATDPFDVVFLAQQVRKVSPDVRLFTFGSDILYTHPEFAADLHGMLVVSPYPFFGSGGWGEAVPSATRTPFTSEAAEGIYNAARALLGRGAPFAEYAPFPARRDCDLPIWITAIGLRGAWPVAMRGWCDCARYTVTSAEVDGDHTCRAASASGERPARTEAEAPILWVLFELLLFFTTLAVCAVYLVARFAPPRARPDDGAAIARHAGLVVRSSWIPGRALGGARGAPTWPAAARTLFALLLLAALQAAVSGAMRLHALAGTPLAALVTTAWLLSGAALIPSVAVAAWDAARAERSSRLDALFDAFVPALVLASTAIFAAHCGGVAWPHLDATARDLLYVRVVDLASGLSPILPLVFGCACLFTATVGSLLRLDDRDALLVRDAGAARAPFDRVLGEDAVTAAGIAPLERSLLRAYETFPALGLPYVASAALLTAVPVVFLVLRPPQMLEGSLASFVFVMLFLGCLAATASSLVRLFAFSFRLKALLARVARHPIADALARVPAPLAKTAEQQVSSRTPRVTDFALAVRTLTSLARRAPEASRVAAGFTFDVAALEQQLADDLAREAEGLTDARGAAIVPRVVALAASLVPRLAPWWRNVAPLPPAHAPAPAANDETPAPPPSALDAYDAALSGAERAWLRDAEDAVAIVLALFLAHYMRLFRVLTTVITAGGLWTLCMVSSYAVDARRLLMTFIWVGLLAAVLVGLWIFVQLDRDELLSRIGRTTPGRVTLDAAFARRVLTWGLLPMLSVAAVHYPEVTHALFAWLQPLLTAVR